MYLWIITTQACAGYVKRKKGKKKWESKIIYLDEMRSPDDDRNLKDELKGDDDHEKEIVAQDLRSRIAALYRAVGCTILTAKQRILIAERVMDDIGLTAMAKKLDCTPQTVLNRTNKAKKCIKRVLEEDITVEEYLWRHFIPEFKRNEENRKKMTAAGINFTAHGEVDLSEAGSNLFLVTVFEMENGSKRSGFDWLELKGAETVYDFFAQKCTDSAIITPPLKRKEGESISTTPGPKPLKARLTEDQIIAELRSEKNLKTLREFEVEIQDGKCHVNIQTRHFDDKVIKFIIHGKDTAGSLVLEALGLAVTHDGIIELCKKIFPDIDLIFWRHTNGVSMEKEPEEKMLQQLRTSENIQILKSVARRIEGDVIILGERIGRDDFKGRYFQLKGKTKKYGITAILEKFDKTADSSSIIWLYEKVFGEDKVKTERDIFREKVAAYLKNEVFGRFGITETEADIILPKGVAKQFQRKKDFEIDGKCYSLKRLTAKALWPSARGTKIPKVSEVLKALLKKDRQTQPPAIQTAQT